MSHPYMPLYVDDFEAATAHLSMEEDGIYNRLLRLAWRTPGCSLPADHDWIARKIRCDFELFERSALPILREFFSLRRGRYFQKRQKAEYDDISCKKRLRQNAGKIGGFAKALNKKKKHPSNASVLLGDTRASPEPYPELEQEELQNPIQEERNLSEGTSGATVIQIDGRLRS
jgi:uncharacterized protein YdaU (DUF1376 family)